MINLATTPSSPNLSVSSFGIPSAGSYTIVAYDRLLNQITNLLANKQFVLQGA